MEQAEIYAFGLLLIESSLLQELAYSLRQKVVEEQEQVMGQLALKEWEQVLVRDLLKLIVIFEYTNIKNLFTKLSK